jgi:hypothetical protein
MNGDEKRNARGKIIERIEDEKKHAPKTLEEKLTDHFRKRSNLDRKKRLGNKKVTRFNWENNQDD